MIPKIIWTFLSKPHDGFTHSPKLLNITRKNWNKFAKEYEIRVVDDFNICYYLEDTNLWENIDTNYPIKPVFQSDIIRLGLLKKYGGTYIDANVLLLDDIDNVLGKGGTLFTSMNTDSNEPLFENWFISCSKGDEIISEWLDEVLIAKTDIDKYIKYSTMMAKVLIKDLDVSAKIFCGIGLQRYLTCHFAIRNIYEQNKERFSKYRIYNGRDTSFYYHKKFEWENVINQIFDDGYQIDKSKVCLKIRSADRQNIELDKIPKELYEK